jgi:hypothetical protein
VCGISQGERGNSLPLSEKARIEVYLPELPRPAYLDLLDSLNREFTYAFGGCTIVRGLFGSYLARHGQVLEDRINLVVTDTQLIFTEDFEIISRYTDHLRQAAFVALDEEAVLIVAYPVFHSA